MAKAKEVPVESQKMAEVVKMNQLKGWQAKFKLNGSGGVQTKSIYNIRLILEHDDSLKDLIAYDEFADQIIKTKSVNKLHIKKGYWTDSDDSVLRSYIEEKYNLLFSKENIADGVVTTSKLKTTNPLKDRVESQQWDHEKRAERLFIDYLGAEDTNYTRELTRVWLTGAIARIYKPGVKFEIVPILEGKQGIGKSTVTRNLFPDGFNDSIKSLGKQKDDYQQLQGSWIIEIAELSAMKRTDIDNMKNFISAQVDTYRNSYGRYTLPHPRKCVFIGTTNQLDYLKDATGERRFYPIKCGIQTASKNVWNVDENDIKQILAEAKHWFDNSEPLVLSSEMLSIAKKYQSEAETVDPMKEAIIDYISMKVPTNWDTLSGSVKHSYFKDYGNDLGEWLKDKVSPDREALSKTTTREILEVVFDKTPDKYLTGRTNTDAKKIKLIMDNMDGWENDGNVNIGGKRARGYRKIQD